jgi:apolipoprotein N-acyltransferase
LSDFLQIPSLVAWGLLLLLCAISTIPYAVFGWIYGYAQWLRKPLGALIFSVAFTICVSWFPYLFPGNLAHSQYRYPLLIQVVEGGGVPLLLFLMVWVNTELVVGLHQWQEGKKDLHHCLIAGLILISIVAFGKIRLVQFHQMGEQAGKRDVFKVGVIQPNLAKPPRRGGKQVKDPLQDAQKLNTLLMLSEDLVKRHPDVDLIAWPEVPFEFSWVERVDQRRQVQALIQRLGKPFVIVSTYVFQQGETLNGLPAYFNMAHWIDDKGLLQASYAKQILLPFSEYLPFERQLPQSCKNL